VIVDQETDAARQARDIIAKNREYTLFSWSVQQAANPIAVSRAKGTCFWDVEGKRYLDMSSQLMNMNIGHGHPKVIEAIKAQADQLAFIYPGCATKPRGEAAEKLSRIAPGNLKKVFFTTGGADAIENAMKMARMVTGRQKVMTRYRAYHGATFGAMSAGGDPRRLANEPGVPWIVRMLDPYSYRSPLYRHCTPEEGDKALVDLIQEQIEMEGPNDIAAILLEGYSGSSGIIAPSSPAYWKGVRGLCDRYGIKLIVDEVMSGFGRTGEWWGIDHYGVQPDLLCCAKGLTCGYMPLGAVVVSPEIGEYYDTRPLWAGLTYSSHPISCAAASACLDVYTEDNLIENGRKQGEKLARHLDGMKAHHKCIGDHRGIGLFRVLELVKNRQTKEPISGFNKPASEPMQKISGFLREKGFSTQVRWDWIFVVPPLCITDAELEESMAILDEALSLADPYCEG
jgi:taurine--2-oxoglutarate transaminase